ncbi:hypothetical protein PPYR_09244 [Photinus pyralis]|uniref:Myotubularin phosphatase domain-containing protein n=1 Tax=Photinus pyralis TaxID=7054 RepID=A0A1Y1JVW7_PHOPY|nr:myotubularin-related protein 9 [Photinus pyralis]KAB0798251.1 hypothetical protein PPYR_09244 [Photinus pyralis]
MEFSELIRIPKLDDVVLHNAFHDPLDAMLCITSHHLILSSRKEHEQEIWLLHQSIDFVEKRINNNNSNLNGGSLILKCKDLQVIQLDINNTDDLHNVYYSLERLSNLDNPTLMYPFFYRPMYTILEDGHNLFKPELEFSKLIASDEWRLSTVNKDYSVCPTYGPSLVVPKCIDDDTLTAAANFREGGRFPMLSYRHDNGAVLLRSSQPLVGANNKRSRSDEKIVNAVLGTTNKGYIIDTRSASTASQCKTKGGGTEPDGNYPQWRRIHKNLDKISNCNGVILESFAKLMEAVNDVNCSSDKWMSRLENSNWLTFVQSSLNAACLVAQCLDQEGVSVLVHGTYGFDTTLLVTSIVQVILNPDCRTVRGLQALIEREWLQAGHPFQSRHVKGCYSNIKNKQIQPTFVLFLDCVQQLHHQFPCSFEFTTHMLVLLFEHSYFSQFGTFLGNCEADREKLNTLRTTSLWSYLNRPDIMTSLLNPMYDPNRATIWPSVAPVSLILWNDLYLRWVISQTQSKNTLQKIQGLIQNDKNLRSQVTKLRKQLVDLQKEWDSINVDDGTIQNDIDTA